MKNLLLSQAGGITLAIVGVLVLVVIVMAISYYNKFVRLSNNAQEAFSTMDVYLKKRYDLIPNIVETVKGYAKHEKETLQNVIEARNKAVVASNPNEKIECEKEVTSALRQLMVVVEQYPTLQANQNFLDLQQSLKTMEKEIESSRKYYNGNVKQLNTAIMLFPANIFAKMFKIEKMSLFEIVNKEERENVKVSFE